MKTMKHATLISLSLLAVVCSCTKVDVRTTEQPEREICFSEPVVSTMTKAVTGEINGLYPVDESFGVFSIYHQNTFSGWANGTRYIAGAEFSYDASLDDDDSDGRGGWSGGYFFPKTGYLSFAAYSPFDAHSNTPGDGTGTFAYGPSGENTSKGLTITDFTVAADPAEQFDLMYSERIYDRQTSIEEGEEYYEGMELVFHHALSSIRFNVQKKEEYPGHIFTLTNISIGDVKYKGSFAENVVNETSSTYSSVPAWDVDDAKVSTPYMLEIDSNPETSEVEPLTVTKYGTANFHEVPQGAILMPQVFKEGSDVKNGDAYIVIDYMVNVEGFEHPVTQTATVRLSAITDIWEMGKRYIYNIILGYDTITVSPTVPGWEDVTIEAGIK